MRKGYTGRDSQLFKPAPIEIQASSAKLSVRPQSVVKTTQTRPIAFAELIPVLKGQLISIVDTIVLEPSHSIFVTSTSKGIEVQSKTTGFNQIKTQLLKKHFNLKKLNNDNFIELTSNPECQDKMLCFANYENGSDILTTKDLVKLTNESLLSFSVLPVNHFVPFTFEHTFWVSGGRLQDCIELVPFTDTQTDEPPKQQMNQVICKVSHKLLTLLSTRKLSSVTFVYILNEIKQRMVPSLLRIDNYEVIESVNKSQSKPSSMHSKKQSQKIEVNMIYNSVEKPQTTYFRTECEHQIGTKQSRHLNSNEQLRSPSDQSVANPYKSLSFVATDFNKSNSFFHKKPQFKAQTYLQFMKDTRSKVKSCAVFDHKMSSSEKNLQALFNQELAYGLTKVQAKHVWWKNPSLQNLVFETYHSDPAIQLLQTAGPLKDVVIANKVPRKIQQRQIRVQMDQIKPHRPQATSINEHPSAQEESLRSDFD